MLGAYATGLATGLSLIVAIGAQNAFVLRQGLLRAHVLPLVLLCAVSDAILIALGVAGFGAVVALVPELPKVFSALGAVFLAVYGALRMRAAWRGGEGLDTAGADRGLWRTLAAGAAFTWLNPHVYLDTLALMGAVSTGFHGLERKMAFALGATSGSFIFFFGLGYGARLLAPLLRRPTAWRLLDLMIAVMMWAIAARLALPLLL